MLWRRLDAPGHDACTWAVGAKGRRLRGSAVFSHALGPARLTYTISYDAQWNVRSGRVIGSIGARKRDWRITQSTGDWTLNGAACPALSGLEHLDYSFTPATNFSQLRRVPPTVGESVSLPAVWLNLDDGSLSVLPQTYQRRSASTVWYDAPTTGYSGLLEVAANGFVAHYPALWRAEVAQPS